MREKAEGIVRFENERFRATEWRFSPGAETGWHVHGHDYVVVPLTDGRLLLEEPDGRSRHAPLTRHAPYGRGAGVHHNVVNDSDAPLAFLEVEVLEDPLLEERERVLQCFVDAWNARDVDALMACMAPDCEFRTASGPDADGARHVGREAVRAAYAAVFERFPQAAWTNETHRMIGDLAVSHWRFVGHDREGRAVEVDGCDLLRFSGGLIDCKDSYRKARA